MDGGIEINGKLCKVLSKKYYKKESEKDCLREIEKYETDNDFDSLVDKLSELYSVNREDLLVIASDCTKTGRLNR
jgi:hypothetical protein